MTTNATQKLLPFDDPKELARRERIERLLGTIPMIDRASAPRFDYDEATATARKLSRQKNP